MVKHAFPSPLRYPGGKGMLTNFAKLIISSNELLDGHYVEVYAGGASIALTLLFDEYVQHIHINDLSKSIYALWKSVVDDTENFCKYINDVPVTIEEWKHQKNIQLHPYEHTSLELGFSTFFLNRTNRSGILKGGVIGGKAQDGKWKLDARFNKVDLIYRIQRIARYSNRISLYNEDAAAFITKFLPKINRHSLVYLDPPYYAKSDSLYENYYSHDDHTKIANLIKKINQPWIVSYDNTPPIMELYRSFRNLKYDLSYSAQVRYAGSEIMFFSNKLVLPYITNPVQVKSQAKLSPALL